MIRWVRASRGKGDAGFPFSIQLYVPLGNVTLTSNKTLSNGRALSGFILLIFGAVWCFSMFFLLYPVPLLF